MIAALIAALGTGLGRFTVIALVLSAIGGWFAWEQQNVGARKIVAAAKKEGKRRNATSRTIRKAARRPGSLDRLLRSDCRDCD